MKKAITYTAILISALILQSCTVEIPDKDNDPPTFSFLIKGDGLNRTFNQDDDYERIQLNLRIGETYNFVFTVSDAGGLAQASYEVVRSENYNFDSPIEYPWRPIYAEHTRRVDWIGDRENPLNGTVLTGSFQVLGPADKGFFHFYAKDFGGNEGTTNSLFETLTVSVGTHASEVMEYGDL